MRTNQGGTALSAERQSRFRPEIAPANLLFNKFGGAFLLVMSEVE